MIEQRNFSGFFRSFLRVVIGFVLIVVAILVGLIINQQIGLVRDRQRYPAPGEMLDVDGHLMHLNCTGEGAPTVVIDAGNGSFSAEWYPVQNQVSQLTRVCTFDRPGYGWSEPVAKRRDGMQVVSEMHALLQSAGESAPYVLVGHSLGGVHVCIFTALYPEEVAGLVLVDSPWPLVITPDYEAQMRSSIGFYQVMGLLTRIGMLRVLGPLGGENSMPETARKLPANLQETYLTLLLDPMQYRTAVAEMQQLPETFEQANQLAVGDQFLGDLPLIVLTAGKMAAAGSTPFETQLVPVDSERIGYHAELAAASSHGQQRVIADSGHLMHLDAPLAVVQAVQEMVIMYQISQ